MYNNSDLCRCTTLLYLFHYSQLPHVRFSALITDPIIGDLSSSVREVTLIVGILVPMCNVGGHASLTT